jgi:hypothetical protein
MVGVHHDVAQRLLEAAQRPALADDEVAAKIFGHLRAPARAAHPAPP